jgi:hypothetical protein
VEHLLLQLLVSAPAQEAHRMCGGSRKNRRRQQEGGEQGGQEGRDRESKSRVGCGGQGGWKRARVAAP